MGLDITAYRGLRKIAGENEAAEDLTFYINPDFPGRADDIDGDAHYDVEDAFGFRAGAYSAYSRWREYLAALAAYEPVNASEYSGLFDRQYAELHPRTVRAWDDAPRPFAELINFSDCEGVIGTKTSAKLAADFAAFQEMADAHPDPWFREKYAEWRKAFEMASDNGAVAFH